MTLRSKITSLVSLITAFLLILMMAAVSYIVVSLVFAETGKQALMISRMTAAHPQLIEAFRGVEPARVIQPIAEEIRKRTGAEFVVVSSMNLIRYSHPNPQEIGKRMVGEDNDDVLKGLESITKAHGTLGYSIRGKVPVFDADRRQVGVVSTGFLVDDIWSRLSLILLGIGGIGTVAIASGCVAAYFLSRHIKKEILDMEPHEIAFSTREQAAVLEAIREGIVAVNKQGDIVTCNREAKKMLHLENSDVVGKKITSLIHSTRLPEVLENGIPQYDQQTVVGNTLVIANRVPVVLSGQIIGAVATFRDKMQLDQIDTQLADISKYADTLRSQRHEFMNKLHLISGLIKTAEYDLAKNVIEQVNDEYQESLQFYLARIRDAAVVGILIGKSHRAGELGIRLEVDPDSWVSEQCSHRDIVVTILGNTIENAFEALHLKVAGGGEGRVGVLVREDDAGVILRVSDNGPGVDPAIRDHLFEKGVSTKGAERGVGLSLISGLVSHVEGTVACTSTDEGTLVDIHLPAERRATE